MEKKSGFFTFKLPSRSLLIILGILALIYGCMYAVRLAGQSSKPIITFEFVPMGDIDIDIVKKIASRAAQRYGVKHSVTEPCAMPDFAYDSMRRQYNAAYLRNYLRTLPSKQNVYRLGITDQDITGPNANFLFAEHDQPGNTAIMSICRMREPGGVIVNRPGMVVYTTLESEMFMLNRGTKMAVHQFGHLLNLLDCQSDPKCVMHYSGNLLDLEMTREDFCHMCKMQVQQNYHPQ